MIQNLKALACSFKGSKPGSQHPFQTSQLPITLQLQAVKHPLLASIDILAHMTYAESYTKIHTYT